MGGWWIAFWDKWSREDPMLLMNFVSLVFTVLIPITLWWLGRKQAKRDSLLVEQQTIILERQDKIMRRQRRDALLESITRSSDATYLGILWREIRESPEYEREDREFLLARLRTNPVIALPGTSTGVRVQDDLTDAVVSDYVDGFERRYTENVQRYIPYPGLLDFIECATQQRAKIEISRIVALVTGPTAEKQRPDHHFYRNLVERLPGLASSLLYKVESIDCRAPGGLRLNVLTGTLLAVRDVEMRRGDSRLHPDEVREFRIAVSQSLACLFHWHVLHSFETWEREGANERIIAMVAWLVRVVGWVVDTDEHLGKRMVESLAFAIDSIPNVELDWGSEASDARQGFEWIRTKRSDLWKEHGERLESAAARVGWGTRDGDDG